MEQKETAQHREISKRLATIGVGGNIVLAAGKMIAGIVSGSVAMISDAAHSLSDVIATAVAYIGVRIAARKPDKGHPYGHERFECLASLVLAFILAATGAAIGFTGAKHIAAFILSGDPASAGPSSDAPLWVALVAAIASIAIKEAMFRYTRHWARIMESPAFLADAQHHRSDALSSVGALVGIGAQMAGFPLGDSIASIIICLFILKMAWGITSDAVDRMVDAPCSDQTERSIRTCLNQQTGVIGVDMLHTRLFGAKAYVDAEISVKGDLSLVEAHEIAHRAHDAVEQEFPQVKHVMIHVNPA